MRITADIKFELPLDKDKVNVKSFAPLFKAKPS